jgi:hypothetical protein
MITELAALPDVQTMFNDFLVSGDLTQYYTDLKALLEAQGGGLKSVWPRDVCQEKISSESAAITAICRTIMEKIGVLAGYVGYETGGAQQQVGAKNLFDPIDVLIAGCPSNMPANALTRSFWLNSLAKTTPKEALFILQNYAKRIREHYRIPEGNKVPWFPNLFHAGNHTDMDAVADIMLSVGITPIPNWAWGPHYTDAHLNGWVNRQLDVFETHGETLQEIRIKNPGQQKEWTVENIWKNIQAIRNEYKNRYGEQAEPIINIHNHDLNRGTEFSAAIIARDLLKKAQSEGYRYLVIDTAPASVPTHNNHDIVAEALTMSAEQKEQAEKLTTYASYVYGLLGRFEISPLPSTTPNWSTWAGGTGSSDRVFATDMGIDEKDIESAKHMGEQVLELGTIVTPYSEWSMRFGMICWKAGLHTAADVRTYIQTGQQIEATMANGATIGISKEILEGLQAWETLLPRPSLIEKLLDNYGMPATRTETPSHSGTTFDPSDLKKNMQEAYPGYPVSDSDVTVATAFGSIGKELIAAKASGTDRTAFIKNPLPLYTPIAEGVQFTHEGLAISYLGRDTDTSTAMTTLTFGIGENTFTTTVLDKKLAQTLGIKEIAAAVKADPSNPLELGISMPGKITDCHIKEGDVLSLKNGRVQLIGVEAMKMQNMLTLDPETFVPMLIKSGIISDTETIGALTVKSVSVKAGDTVELNDRYIVLEYQK